MSHRISAVIVCALAVPSAADAITWDWSYEAISPGLGNRTPNESGAIMNSAGTPWTRFTSSGDSNLTTNSATGGIYSASTINTNNGAWFSTPSNNGLANLQSSTGYTVEARVRINQIDEEESVAGSGSFGIVGEDGDTSVSRWWNLGSVRNGSIYQVVLFGSNYNDGVRYTIDNTEFYTIRITALGNTATLYVNDNPTPVGSINMRNDLNGGLIEFGDFTGVGDSSYELDYLRVTAAGAIAPVPEPAALGLLGIGTAAFLRRRRAV